MVFTSRPKYVFLKEELARRIAQDGFFPDGRIPSEHELCRAYGFSQMTVRRALTDLVHEGKVIRIRGKGSFVSSDSPEKRDSSLKPAKTGIISLVLMSYEAGDSSIINIISGVQKCLSANGYSMTMECSNRNTREEAEIIDRYFKNRVDGVLLFASDPDNNAPKLAALEAAGIPLVLIDRMPQGFPCTMVASYHTDGMFQVTRYLIELGHRRIAFITTGIPTHVNTDRLAGYKIAHERYGLPFDRELCPIEQTVDIDKLENLIRTRQITAAACINDMTAIEVMALLRNRGYKVPDNISVSGFDDNVSASYANLTTVRQHYQEIGAAAAEKLLERIRFGSGNSMTLFPVELVVRGSTAPPPLVMQA